MKTAIPPEHSTPMPLLEPERGHALLVVGATVNERRKQLDSWIADVARNDAPPLVVRVPPRERHLESPEDGVEISPLQRSVTSRVEAALHGSGVPGALYDDPAGGPLAELAGWLFRIRASHRRGMVLVIDELDGWIDARGTSPAPSARSDRSPARWMTHLLDARSDRPIAVIASVRASDASGSAALPAGLLQRFDHVTVLRGAPTVTRDPGTIVAALSGRSFTVEAMRSALPGWLELTALPDDTVVLFTSPLAPTSLGLAIEATNAVDEIEWIHRPAPREPLDTSVVIDPKHTATPARHQPWTEALRSAIEVRDLVAGLRSLPLPNSVETFTSRFVHTASRLPLAMELFARGEGSVGLVSTRLMQRAADELDHFESQFSAFYKSRSPGWSEATTRPLMLCDLPEKLSRCAVEHQARGTCLVILSGLRLDAWQSLRTRMKSGIAPLQWLEEGTLWAGAPTEPMEQYALLARGHPGNRDEVTAMTPLAAPTNMDEAVRPRRETFGAVEVHRIDAYAHAAARTTTWREGDSPTPLHKLFSRIEKKLFTSLAGWISTMPSRTAIVFAGDVGIGTKVTDQAHFPFGGDSPFQVIVPYVVSLWTGG